MTLSAYILRWLTAFVALPVIFGAFLGLMLLAAEAG